MSCDQFITYKTEKVRRFPAHISNFDFNSRFQIDMNLFKAAVLLCREKFRFNRKEAKESDISAEIQKVLITTKTNNNYHQPLNILYIFIFPLET